MATPPLRRSWPVTLPSVPCAGLLALACLVGFILIATRSAALADLALTPAEAAGRPWTLLTYPFAHSSLLPCLLDLGALFLLATRLESAAGAARLLGWFAAGTLVGAAVALLQPEAPLFGTGSAILGMSLGLAHNGGARIESAPPGARGRWLAVALSIAALVVPAAAMPSGPVRFALIGALGVSLLVRGRRARQTTERRVEAPNSHFNMPGVQHRDLTTPWDAIDLDALHEVNRAVVETLLHRARELGPDFLGPADRELLDRMATAARQSAERLEPDRRR